MANSVKHTILTKKINGVLYDLYPKTDASIVVHNDTTVAAELESIASTLHDLANGDTSIDARIEAAKTALYNQIMGITEEDGATVAEAFDTLKEVANYLTEHGSVVQGFTNDIASLKTTVGNAESGLVKDVADLKAVGSVKVEASETNGNIKINGVETKVYDDSAIAATKIVEDATHRFVTDTDKAAWNANAEVIVADSVPADLAETDLLFLVISEA